MMQGRMTIPLPWCLAILTVLPFCGCVTKSTARADARAAYLAGQKDAFATIAATQRTSITVVGRVENPQVPWVEGLTLAQAIATANYAGVGSPKEIILLRRGERATINPKDLLNGHDVPLEPGDTITIQ
jgi:protein involved in polysaccharide export with SLBB domain